MDRFHTHSVEPKKADTKMYGTIPNFKNRQNQSMVKEVRMVVAFGDITLGGGRCAA